MTFPRRIAEDDGKQVARSMHSSVQLSCSSPFALSLPSRLIFKSLVRRPVPKVLVDMSTDFPEIARIKKILTQQLNLLYFFCLTAVLFEKVYVLLSVVFLKIIKCNSELTASCSFSLFPECNFK